MADNKKSTPTPVEAATTASTDSSPAAKLLAEHSQNTVTLTEAQLAALVEKQVAETLARVNPSQSSEAASLREAESFAADALGKAIAVNTAKLAGKKTVDPDVIVARERLWGEMEAAIDEARQKGDKPEYTLVEGKSVFLPCKSGYTLVEAKWQDTDRKWKDTIFGWWGIPNEVMVPQNGSAKRIHALFMKAIAYNPNEKPKHAVKDFDISFIAGGNLGKEAPELGIPQVTPVGGGVEIISGQTKTTRSVAVLGGASPVEQTY